MNKEANARYIYGQLTQAGMAPEGACGVLGNLEAESGLEPTNLQNTYNSRFGMTDAEYVERVNNGTYRNFIRDQAGFGLAQWTYWSRKQMLLERIQSLGYGSIGSLEGQVDYLLWEMKEYYPNVWSFLKSATSVRGASNLVLMRYEQPADQSVAVQEYRTALGEKWYEKLVAGTVPALDPKTDERPVNEYWPPRMIDKTMSGADVSLLQAVLNCRGYGCRIDGYFSDDTERKVIAFQKDSGLAADGVAGPRTWEKLRW
jgi:hypothetical protein